MGKKDLPAVKEAIGEEAMAVTRMRQAMALCLPFRLSRAL
jgi:hypothetical protein